ncbi:MAG TPA: enoyl-CoA hydratase-related protein [Vicinamibacterales bacterium]
MTMPPLVRSDRRADGWVRLIVEQPPGNILTIAMCEALRASLSAAHADPATRFITIEGAGVHFSYGASIEEHLPDKVGEMLPAFHRLIADLLDTPCPTAAIVRGRCLGGGLEAALACDLVFASHDAKLGVPEIALGVFPPAASVLLPLRIGASRASRVVLTGEILPADWWETAGLVAGTASAMDLEAYVHRWYVNYIASRSGTALRHAAVAARAMFRQPALASLAALERQYLDELMRTADAVEGCAAFLDKRPPQWRHS